MMQTVTTRWGKLVLGGLLGTLAAAALLVVGFVLFENQRKARAGAAAAAAVAPQVAKPVRVGPDALELPPEVVRSLDVHTAQAAPASRPRPLPPFPGTLALDNSRLARVASRFPRAGVAL